jgi:hypothetical protein
MSQSFLFDYGITIQELGRVPVFPAAEVFFRTAAGEWAPAFVLIDSGAVISALPKSDAALLGIDLKSGESAMIQGISGKPLQGWRHKVSIRLRDNHRQIPLVFVNNNMAPRVLGRAGVFEHFTIVLDEHTHRSGLLGTDTPDATVIRSVLDQL